MLNKVMLIGNLGADPEIRRLTDGRPVANLRLATSETWKDKTTGEKKERTEWHRVVCFNEGLCKVIEQYCKKGHQLYIEGQVQTRKWQDKDGVDKYSTEIVMKAFDSKLIMLRTPGNRGPQSEDDYGTTTSKGGSSEFGGRGPQPSAPAQRRHDLDDDIPF